MKLFFRKVMACILIKYFNRPKMYHALKEELNPTPKAITMPPEEAKKLQEKFAKAY